MNDQQLLAAMRQGDQRGLAAYIDAYGGYIHAILRRVAYGASPQDIEEAAADCVLAVWRQAGALEAGKLKAYTGAAARNKGIDLRRRTGEFLPLDEDVIASGEDPLDGAAREEEATRLRGAVDALPPPDREIFIRRYWWGEGLAAIAQALGLSERAVEGRLHRGRKRLLTALEGHYE